MAVERNVEIIVKVLPDKENRGRFEDVMRQIRDVQNRAATAAQSGVRQFTATQAEALATTTTRLKELDAAYQKTAASAADMAARQAASVEKVAASTVKAAEAASSYAQQQREMAQKSDEVVESVAKVLTGVMSLARGMVMVGLIGEENMNKVAQALVRVQAGFDIVRGVMEMTVGIRKWITSYTELQAMLVAANASATASTAALGAAQEKQAADALLAAKANDAAASAAGRLAAANAGAAGTATASGGASLGAGFGVTMTKLAGLGAIAATATAAIASLAAVISTDFREGLLEWLGITSKAADAQKEHTAAMQAAAARDKAAVQNLGVQEERRRNWESYRDTVAPRGAFDLMQDYQAARKASHSAYGMDGSEAALVQRQQATQRELDTLQKMKSLQESQFEETKRYNAERIRGAQEVLRLKQAEYEKQLQLADAIKQERMGAKVSFGNLTPEEQARAIAAKQQMDKSGAGSLSADQRDILGRLGLGSVNEKLDAAAMARADAMGYSGLFGKEEREKEAQARSTAAKLQAEVTGGVRLDYNVNVKLDTDAEAMAEQIAKSITKQMALLPNIDKLIAEALDRQITNRDQVRAFQEKSQREAASGFALGR